MKNLKINTPSLLQFILLILPILILSGPLLSDAAVILIATYLIFNPKILSKDKKIKFFFFFFLSFYILINISAFLSNYVTFTLNSIFYFRFILFAFCFAFIINNPVFFFKYLSLIISIIFIILLIDGLSEFFLSKNLLNYDNKYNNRVSSLFKDELVLGSYTVRLLPILLGSLIYCLNFKRNINYIILVFVYLVGLILILLSGERTSLILFLSFSLFVFIFWKTKLIFKLFLIMTIPILMMLYISDSFKSRFLIEPLIQTNLVSQNTFKKLKLIDGSDFEYPDYNKINKRKYFFSIHHHRHYSSALKIFKTHFIIGAGPKSFAVSCKEEKFRVYLLDEWEGHIDTDEWSKVNDYGDYQNFDNEHQRFIDNQFIAKKNMSIGYIKLMTKDQACSTHPHNTHIQILSELGLLGYVFILSFIVIIIYLAIKIKFDQIIFKDSRLKDLSIFILGCCFMNLWPLSPSGNFFNNWLSILYYLPVGLLIYCFSQKTIKNEKVSKKFFR